MVMSQSAVDPQAVPTDLPAPHPGHTRRQAAPPLHWRVAPTAVHACPHRRPIIGAIPVSGGPHPAPRLRRSLHRAAKPAATTPLAELSTRLGVGTSGDGGALAHVKDEVLLVDTLEGHRVAFDDFFPGGPSVNRWLRADDHMVPTGSEDIRTHLQRLGEGTGAPSDACTATRSSQQDRREASSCYASQVTSSQVEASSSYAPLPPHVPRTHTHHVHTCTCTTRAHTPQTHRACRRHPRGPHCTRGRPYL